MKAKNLLFSAALLATTLGGGVMAHAADYADSTHAKVDSSIQFEKDTDPGTPVDPTDPGTPVDPTDPTNPNGGELMITYASKLDFGTQKKSGTEFFAKADTAKDGTDPVTGDPIIKNITPMISMKDSRGTDRKGWTLEANLDTPFTDGSGNELAGAELTFKNMFSGTGQVEAPVVSGDTVLSTTPATIAKADSSQGVGNWAVGLGTLQGKNQDTTDGVVLTVPSSSAKNTDTYKTTVTYTLTAQP